MYAQTRLDGSTDMFEPFAREIYSSAPPDCLGLDEEFTEPTQRRPVPFAGQLQPRYCCVDKFTRPTPLLRLTGNNENFRTVPWPAVRYGEPFPPVCAAINIFRSICRHGFRRCRPSNHTFGRRVVLPRHRLVVLRSGRFAAAPEHADEMNINRLVG